MGRNVRFPSDGLSLAGTIETPSGVKPGQRRPAFLVLHGFGSNRTSSNVKLPMQMLNALGYVTMGFDMRGCGESEGERGNLICLEQVSDTKSAVSFMREQPEVIPDKIGLIGSSFGAAVAVYAGAVDPRVGAVISSGGWGDGERKFRGQHTTPEAWKKFTDMLATGEGYREKHGKPMMVPRYDIVPIPQHLRTNLAANSVHEFTWETARSMFDFRADDVVAQMAPRPLLLLHSSVDSVTPTEQSVEMFKRAGQPTDLHLFAETDHFMFAEENTRVRTVVADWLARFFPANAE
jgi:hypothetical protein